jgi:hypothetical protein
MVNQYIQIIYWLCQNPQKGGNVTGWRFQKQLYEIKMFLLTNF